jgi:hypothetical protein
VAIQQFKTTPTQPKDPRANAAVSVGLGWKTRVIAIGIGLLVALLGSQWKMVDKYFPKLNELLHAGSVSSEDDVAYLMGHLKQDLQTLGDPCGDDMNFHQCRDRMIANKPLVEDLNLRVSKMDEAWTAELKDRSVPEACQAEMGKILTAYKNFVSTENQKLGLLDAMDSVDTEKSLMQRYNEVSGQDDAAWGAIRSLRKTDACRGY